MPIENKTVLQFTVYNNGKLPWKICDDIEYEEYGRHNLSSHRSSLHNNEIVMVTDGHCVVNLLMLL